MRRFEPCRLRAFCQQTRLLSECAPCGLPNQPSARILPKVTSDGIEPPLSDLESEVLPLHHEAVLVLQFRGLP